METNKDYRSGFVSFLGRPNTGKSTLTNALVGQKIAITSSKPQTTRRNIRGIVSDERAQVIFVDTPGVHRPRTLLGSRLNDLVFETIADVDLVVLCLPADEAIGPGDKFLIERLNQSGTKTIVAITKTDKTGPEQILNKLAQVDKLGDWVALVPVSAVKSQQLDVLMEQIIGQLPPGPKLYPDDEITDESEEISIAELVREAALEDVRDEMPHSIAVVVDEIVQRKNTKKDILEVRVHIFVERDSQKAILIGKKGARLRAIGSQSRAEIERFLGRSIYLDLHVKIAKDWQRDPKQLRRLGY